MTIDEVDRDIRSPRSRASRRSPTAPCRSATRRREGEAVVRRHVVRRIGRSVSVTSFAFTVTAHVVPAGSGELGVSVNVVAGDAVCVNVRGEPAGHSRLKALAEAVTLSLKLMTMVELTGTLFALLAGVVLMTLGAPSPPATPTIEMLSIARACALVSVVPVDTE